MKIIQYYFRELFMLKPDLYIIDGINLDCLSESQLEIFKDKLSTELSSAKSFSEDEIEEIINYVLRMGKIEISSGDGILGGNCIVKINKLGMKGYLYSYKKWMNETGCDRHTFYWGYKDGTFENLTVNEEHYVFDLSDKI